MNQLPWSAHDVGGVDTDLGPYDQAAIIEMILFLSWALAHALLGPTPDGRGLATPLHDPLSSRGSSGPRLHDFSIDSGRARWKSEDAFGEEVLR